jgi:hypothetical protein
MTAVGTYLQRKWRKEESKIESFPFCLSYSRGRTKKCARRRRRRYLSLFFFVRARNSNSIRSIWRFWLELIESPFAAAIV